MKFLVIGLGSMGKRRIRNLLALGQNDIAGFDPRKDRRDEVSKKFNILTFKDYESSINNFKPEVLIISTSPSLHMEYAIPAAKEGLHCFIEASVVDVENIKKLSQLVDGSNTVVCPSCTMRYHPMPVIIRNLLSSNLIGKPLNINYSTGQYLPDWHPWEDINDFYVSKKETGGAREIVPFELTWLNEIFGNPIPLACASTKISDINADIDDIYHFILHYPENILASITIEVISRPRATRNLSILGSEGKILFSSDEGFIKYIKVGDKDWTEISIESGTLEPGYINPEEPYINELKDFLQALDSGNRFDFPNTLEKDIEVLELLNYIEKLNTI